MCERDDPDMVILIHVDNEKWEPVGEGSSSTIFPRRPPLRRFTDDLNRSFYLGFKIVPETERLVFVIGDCLPKLHLGLMQDGSFGHEYLALISANVAEAGRPLAVPSRTIARRR